jgi:hypothetical protein
MLGDKLLLPLLASLTIVPLTLAQTGNFTIYAYDTGSLICHCSIPKVSVLLTDEVTVKGSPGRFR